MTKIIDRVLAYGCSYTAGTELMDHIHIGMSFDECNKIKKNFIATGWTLENMQKFIERYNINDSSLVEFNRRSSWAGQLANLLDKPFENRAEGGSSLDQIYFSLHKDYIDGKILSTDLVLVGITTVNRTVKFKHNRVSSLQLGQWIKKDQSLAELFDDDYLIFSYFKTLALINGMKSLINIRIQPIVNDINPYKESFKFSLRHTRDYATYIWDSLKDIIMLPEEYLQPHIVDGNLVKCGFMHETVESHIELADKIFKQVNFNDK
jgi:hypothetical protein